MALNPEADQERARELSAIIKAVRERVRARYPEGPDGGTAAITAGAPDPGPYVAADLLPILHARDAALAKAAAIGGVNPRRGGAVNRGIQAVKKTIARSLQWFVRDQIVFNREMIAALDAILEALNDHNRELGVVRDPVRGAQVASDVRSHWNEWRRDWERKLADTEAQYLRNVADLHLAFQHRASMLETEMRGMTTRQHEEFTRSLDKASTEIQKRLWADVVKVRSEFDRLIHEELRIIRLRSLQASTQQQPPPALPGAASPPARSPDVSALDYTRFADRFRGADEDIRRSQAFYRPYFEGRNDVLDIGCGRGEFLELMRDAGVQARGIDLGEESVATCRGKGLDAEVADLFVCLPQQPEGEFDGIFCSQVIEHLEPARLPEMIRLCARALRRGGLMAIETPDPACLAIFATYFYLDPTHIRPVPHPLVRFYMEESGFGEIEVHQRAPAVDSWPEIADLPPKFRERFFGGLDYAILGRRL